MDGELSKKMIVLEGGNVFVSRPSRVEWEPEGATRLAKFIADVHKKAWTHAIGVGDLDLLLGADFIKNVLYQEYGLRLVCANLYSTVENVPLVEPYVVIPRDVAKGRKIIVVVIGLLGRKPVENLDNYNIPLPMGFNVQQPAEALNRILKKMEERTPKPDIYVILAHMTPEELKELVPSIPKNAIVFRSYNVFTRTNRIEFIEHVPVIQTRGYGQVVARVEIQFANRDQPFKEFLNEEEINKQISTVQKMLDDTKKRMETASESQKARLSKRLADYQKRIAELKAELKKKRWAPNMLKLVTTVLDKSVADDADVASMISNFKAEEEKASASCGAEKEKPAPPRLAPSDKGAKPPMGPSRLEGGESK